VEVGFNVAQRPSGCLPQKGPVESGSGFPCGFASARQKTCRAAGLSQVGQLEDHVAGDDLGVGLRRADGGVIAVEVVGEPDASPVLFCHGLADSRLSARGFAGVARELGLRLVAADRPGVGGTDARRLNRVVD
jgi:hypothetical protein